MVYCSTTCPNPNGSASTNISAIAPMPKPMFLSSLFMLKLSRITFSIKPPISTGAKINACGLINRQIANIKYDSVIFFSVIKYSIRSAKSV